MHPNAIQNRSVLTIINIYVRLDESLFTDQSLESNAVVIES